MNADLKSQIADLIAQGAQPQLVAATLGLDVSAILDVLQDPIVMHKLRSRAAERLQQALDMDELATTVESIALARLVDAASMERDPRKLVAIYTAMNKGGKRVAKPEEAGLSEAGDVVVNLVLPASAVARREKEVQEAVVYEMDAAGQVVSVGGQSMQTMDATNVLKLAQQASPLIAELSVSKGQASIVRMEDI